MGLLWVAVSKKTLSNGKRWFFFISHKGSIFLDRIFSHFPTKNPAKHVRWNFFSNSKNLNLFKMFNWVLSMPLLCANSFLWFNGLPYCNKFANKDLVMSQGLHVSLLSYGVLWSFFLNVMFLNQFCVWRILIGVG